MKKYLLLFSVAILSSCQDGTVVEESVLIGAETNVAETLEQNPNLKAKNIILFIGDGMGPNQVALARFSVGGANHRLSFENFPVTGIVLNHSAQNLYTDSAASATTWAAGVKTKNGYLSVDSDNKFLPTIPELLSTKGYLTGLVATSSITHATPAAFYAHINSRSKHKKIAEMLVESDIAIALGGGSEFFKMPLSNEAIHIINNGDSLDENNLIEYSRVLGLFGEDGLDRRLSPPTQLKMTETALDFLDSKTLNCPGFFLMSEGSQIDWGGHDNNVKYMLAEFADFDDSIAAAIEFAKQDKETLILVTADHATGGLVLQKPRGSSIRAQWTTTSHDLSSINIYAYGPGAEKFSGVMDNTEIFDRMLQALDYENLDSNNCVD
ncbi:alkaline phosphatase [Gammaproteobacteria bacterium]|nr:alkaline phosphatase [Gammaproteobacteria bacterium]MDA9834303.1 alkaline phosphatase [Gammaproteobacteria bacterium]MDA9979101.1 alkaline phosphatase [Gammaproteobacteria bacterium]MDC3371567.1 alkaline phosphatase [Gammaproteobacteria bacterium]